MNSSDYLLLSALERQRKRKEAKERAQTVLIILMLPILMYGCLVARWNFWLMERWLFE